MYVYECVLYVNDTEQTQNEQSNTYQKLVYRSPASDITTLAHHDIKQRKIADSLRPSLCRFNHMYSPRKPNLIPSIIRQPSPLQKQPKHIHLHILFPKHLRRPLPTRLRNFLSFLYPCFHFSFSTSTMGLSSGIKPWRSSKIHQRAEQTMETDVYRYEMAPSCKPTIPPRAENARSERQGVRLQEGQEAA